MSGPFCILSDDGLGVRCSRCGSWRRGNAPPDCPPYVTRSEPDYARLPEMAAEGANQRAHQAFMDQCDAETEAAMIAARDRNRCRIKAIAGEARS